MLSLSNLQPQQATLHITMLPTQPPKYHSIAVTYGLSDAFDQWIRGDIPNDRLKPLRQSEELNGHLNKAISLYTARSVITLFCVAALTLTRGFESCSGSR